MASRLAPARLVVALAALCALAACKEKPTPAPVASRSSGAARHGSIGATTGLSIPLTGSAANIKHYLETVDTVVGATFTVKYTPRTVIVDRAAAMRSLHEVSADGATFTFDAAEPALQQLKPGSVLLVWGIALRKVASVESRGAEALVHTNLATLPDAIASGKIAWKAPAKFDKAMITLGLPITDTTPVKTSRSIVPRPSRFPRLPALTSLAFALPGPEPDSGDEAASPGGSYEHLVTGGLGKYEYELAFSLIEDGVDFDAALYRTEEARENNEQNEAAKERMKEMNEQSQKQREELKKNLEPQEEKEKQRTPADTRQKTNIKPELPLSKFDPGAFLDMRIYASGQLTGLSTAGDIEMKDMGMSADFHGDLHGMINLKFVARLGAPENFNENFTLNVPVSVTIPLIVGGFPLMIQYGVNFKVQPSLSSKYAYATGEWNVRFNGGSNITAGGGHVNADGTVQDETGFDDEASKTMSLGVIGVVAAMQARVGLGIGLFSTGAVAYVDVVVAAMMVSSGQVGIAPCQNWGLNFSSGAGVVAEMLGFQVAMSDKKILYQKQYHWTRPDKAMCQNTGD